MTKIAKDFSEKLKQQKVKYEKKIAQANLDIETLKERKKEEQKSNASNKRWKEEYKKQLEAFKIELIQKRNIIFGLTKHIDDMYHTLLLACILSVFVGFTIGKLI